MEAWRWPHPIQDTGLSPVGQVLTRDEGSMRGIGWKPQETMDVRMWGRWGSEESSHRKGRLPGGGEVAFGGPRETRTGFVRLMWNFS